MKLNNKKVGGDYAGQVFDSKILKAATQQLPQSKNTLAEIQHAIREHRKQIEDFQIKIQKHVQQIVALRQEEQALLKEQTIFEVGKIQRELCDIDKKNKQNEADEKKHRDTMAKQMLVHKVLYEGEF